MPRALFILFLSLLPSLLLADSLDGQPAELQYTDRWITTNTGLLEVQLQGQNDYQPAARYHFSDQYLVTESNTGKMIWQRR